MQVAPLQGMEIGKLKNRIDDYEKFQNESREKYVQMRFYFYNCKSPYEHLSRANTDIEQLEVQVLSCNNNNKMKITNNRNNNDKQ